MSRMMKPLVNRGAAKTFQAILYGMFVAWACQLADAGSSSPSEPFPADWENHEADDWVQ